MIDIDSRIRKSCENYLLKNNMKLKYLFNNFTCIGEIHRLNEKLNSLKSENVVSSFLVNNYQDFRCVW